MLSGIAAGNTTQPMGPRLTTSVPGVSSRRRFSAAIVSVLPPAMWISSSVPTTRSHKGITVCRCALTSPDCTYRCSPRPGLVSPHSTGR